MDPPVTELQCQQPIVMGSDDSRFYLDLQDIEDLDQSFEETLNEMELKSGFNAATFLQKEEEGSPTSRAHLLTSLSSMSSSKSTITDMLHLNSPECQLGSSSHEPQGPDILNESVVQGGGCSHLQITSDLEAPQIKSIFETSQAYTTKNINSCCPSGLQISSSQYYIPQVPHVPAVWHPLTTFPLLSSPMPQLASPLHSPFVLKTESCMKDTRAYVKPNHTLLEHCKTVEDMQRNGTLLPSTSSSVMKANNQLENMHWGPAAKTRAGRKRRMTRIQFVETTKSQIQASTACTIWSIPNSNHLISWKREKACMGSQSKVSCSESSMRFLLQKELKRSDVGSLGRIVLPKKEAETNLPYLFGKEGMTIQMEDFVNGCIWNLRFRFWPNNKSRMYLLENTRDFIKTHNLQEGDLIMLHKDDNAGKYVIKAKKVAQVDRSYTCRAISRPKTSLPEGKQQGRLENVRGDQVNPEWVSTSIGQVPLLQDFIHGQSGFHSAENEGSL